MESKRYVSAVHFLLLVGGIALLWYCGRYFHVTTALIQKSIQGHGQIFSSLVYVVLYVVVTFFVFFSKDAFYIAGALLFGPWISTALVFISEALNAVILFYLARSLGRVFVERMFGDKYKRSQELLGKISFFWLFLFRATPLIPYRFLDLAAGLTTISLRKYMAAVIIGSPIKILLVQYTASALGENLFTDPTKIIEYFLSRQNQIVMFSSLVYIVLVALVIFKIRKRE